MSFNRACRPIAPSSPRIGRERTLTAENENLRREITLLRHKLEAANRTISALAKRLTNEGRRSVEGTGAQ
jgi:hypothetical protein